MKHELAAKNETIELNQDVVAEKIFKLEAEVSKQADQIAVMNGQIVQLQTSLEETRKLTAANEVAAAAERETLTGEIEQYRSIVEMMNAQIEGFEKTSFELVGASLMEATGNASSHVNQQADGKSERCIAYEKMVAENKAAMAANGAAKEEEKKVAAAEQNAEILNIAATSAKANEQRRLFICSYAKAAEEKKTTTVETSTITDSPKSYESITVSEYHVMVKQLKGELSKLLAENMQLSEMVSFRLLNNFDAHSTLSTDRIVLFFCRKKCTTISLIVCK